MKSFSNATVEAKANIYFDGKVVSHSVVTKDGSRKTLGIIFPGSYHFGTEASERMEIIAGSCHVTMDADGSEHDIAAGSHFDVPGNSGFTIESKDGSVNTSARSLPNKRDEPTPIVTQVCQFLIRRLCSTNPLSVCVAVLAILSGCSLRLPIEHQPVSVAFKPGAGEPAPKDQNPLVPVWVLSGRYHTGMVFPYDWLLENGLEPPTGFPAATKYVCMSWGNKDAYSAAGLDSPWKWFRVLFTPTPSVMEMIPCNWNVTEVLPGLLPGQQIWLKMVERERGKGLAHFLNECTRDDLNGKPEIVTRSSWGTGVQLGCTSSYFIPRVCNVWTAQAIESMGYPVSAWNGITARAFSF